MTDLRVTTISGMDVMLEEAAVTAFKQSLRGQLIAPGDERYEEARQVWNADIDRRPGLICRPAGVGDVITAVNFARDHTLLVAVRGGAHSFAGTGVCNGGLVIDLCLMKGIRVDPVRRTVRAEGGVKWGEFDRETQAFGLASDNLLSIALVTANGQLLTTSATEHEDLFWGLRGGGGNFGVVTSFEYQLHRVSPVLAGVVIHPFENANAVLTFYREFTHAAPDELASGVVLMTIPDGLPVAGIIVCYNGPIEKRERVLQPLRSFRSPVADEIDPSPYTVAQKLVDAFYRPGLQVY
jgi:FAD/FMN-containing dehydrogenase